MNLNTIVDVSSPADLDSLPREWRAGDSWLAGGTWLYSEPQPDLRRLVDLMNLPWEPLTVTSDGLDIAATCTIAELYAFRPPPEWRAAALIPLCCRSFQASFKIWNAATVGGNICLALPAGPITALVAALNGTVTIRDLEGGMHVMPVTDFVTGNGQNALGEGALLRSIQLTNRSLRNQVAFRRISLTREGRSTALLIGTVDPESGACLLTVTAATVRPVHIHFERVPDAEALREELERAISDEDYLDDPHGTPSYRRHMTSVLAEEIRAELASRQTEFGIGR